MQMAHINISFVMPWTNYSENASVNGSLNNEHLHPDHSIDTVYKNLNSANESDLDMEFIIYMQDILWTIHTYVWPFLVIITTFGNVTIVTIFFRNTKQTTTNLIFLFIAISDSLTGLIPLPTHMYIYIRRNIEQGWCELFLISRYYLSRAFHTASIFQTLLLGIQRFCCVWFPFKTKSWFTTRRTLIAVAVIFCFAFVNYPFHTSLDITSYGVCNMYDEYPCFEWCPFLWMRMLLVNILPSVILLVITILMILKMFRHNIRKELSSAEQRKVRAQQNNRTSIIVVSIAIIFLISEMPFAIMELAILSKPLINHHNYMTFLDQSLIYSFNDLYELSMVISSHANFWIYIIMNRRVRDNFKSMFLRGIRKLLPKRTNDPITAASMGMIT